MKLNGKTVINIEVDGIDRNDYPDFCDAYFSYATWEDGTELTDDDLELLQYQNGEELHEIVWNQVF